MRSAEIKQATGPGFDDPQESVANIVQNREYRTWLAASSAKLQVGEFLLYLCTDGRRSGSLWRHFEAEAKGGL